VSYHFKDEHVLQYTTMYYNVWKINPIIKWLKEHSKCDFTIYSYYFYMGHLGPKAWNVKYMDILEWGTLQF